MTMPRKSEEELRQQAKAWKKRWRLVDARLAEELRQPSIDTKFERLAVLMASVDEFGWREQLAGEVERVRAMWSNLRKRYGKNT